MGKLEGPLTVDGLLIPKTLSIPAGAVDDQAVAANADITSTKIEHQHRPIYAQESATTAIAETRTIHVVRGTSGKVDDFRAGSIVAATGNATMTVDLKKNGTTVLSAAIVLDSTNTARVPEAAVIDPNAQDLVVDDVLEIAITVAAGTGALGQGLFAVPTIREKAS